MKSRLPILSFLILSLSLAFFYSARGQITLVCGQTLTNTLTVVGQHHTYTYTASAGEVVTIRMVGLSGGIAPFLELRDASHIIHAVTLPTDVLQ